MIDLYKVSDKILSYCELKEDILFQYIPKSQRILYIEKSTEMAQRAIEQYIGKPLEDILKHSGVELVCEDNRHYTNQMNDSTVQSEIYFDKNIKRITIYMEILEKKQKALETYGYDITIENLTLVHLAHEFYHFHEFYNDCRTGELLEPLEYKIFGIIKRKASINRTSEIAAHIFAKEICNLEIHPKLMDYVLQIQQGIRSVDSVEQALRMAYNAFEMEAENGDSKI